jgi:hypothetical protein
MPQKRHEGDLCEVCGFRIELLQGFSEGCPDALECSGFCATVDDKDKVALKTLIEGDFSLWPCRECGVAIEDFFVPNGCCSSCSPKIQNRQREELLRACLPYLPEKLAGKVRKSLDSEIPYEPEFASPRYDRDDPL